MSTHIVSCALPPKLVGAIDKHLAKTLTNRATWIRAAIYEKAGQDGLLRQRANPSDALEIEAILG